MNICVYGAASNLIDKSFIEAGKDLGRKMVERGHGLVFGGGKNGMMGAVATGVYEKNGYILGIIPEFFKQGEEEKFIRQLNAFFHEPKFNDFYQVSLSVGPFLMPSEIVKIGEVDLENDRLTASLNNMFNVILENLKYRGE